MEGAVTLAVVPPFFVHIPQPTPTPEQEAGLLSGGAALVYLLVPGARNTHEHAKVV